MKAQTQKGGGVAWTFIDLAVSRLAVQIDDRHREEEKTELFSRKYNKGRFVRHLCVCVHPSSAVRITRRGWQGNSLSLHCGRPLSPGGGPCLRVCSAVISSWHSLKHISQLIDICCLAIIAKLWSF